MEILIKITQFILSLSLLIVLHELGHFLFARLFKTRVEKFYLFFDPWFSLFKYKKGDTEYGIGWIPLGGYVKISGMIDESMDKEAMAKEPQPYEFRTKPTWQRLLIMIGGVLVNFVFAFLIYAMVLFTWGEEIIPTKNLKYGIQCDSIGIQAGFRDGDKILTVENNEVEDFMKIVPEIVLKNARKIQIERDGQPMEIVIPDSIVNKLIKKEARSFITPKIPYRIDDVVKGSFAEEVKIIKKDKIVQIDSVSIFTAEDLKTQLQAKKGLMVTAKILRNTDTISMKFAIPESGLLGVRLGAVLDSFKLKNVQYGFFESIPAGVSIGFERISSYIRSLGLLFKPETKAYESVGGFISIGSYFPGTWDWYVFWNFTALLSIMLAVVNILPIPALDGGHVLFLLYEMITGRKPSDKFLEYAQLTGMIILLSLVIFANGNDIFKLFK